MSQDKKLRLVPPVGSAPDPRSFDEPPPTEAELAEAEALRAALDEGTEPISNALRAANAPPPLTAPDHEALLARALGDLGAPPTRVEEIEAARLAAELGGKVQGEGSEALQMARALRSAHRPRGLDQITHERVLKKVLGAEVKPAAARGSRIAIVSGLFVAAAALAMFFNAATRKADAPSAAAVAPTAAGAGAAADNVRRRSEGAKVAASPPAAVPRGAHGATRALAPEPAPAATAQPSRPAAASEADTATVAAAYLPSRSTDDLFEPGTQFPNKGGESARIDRIAMARASDLRQNRFAAWGVR